MCYFLFQDRTTNRSHLTCWFHCLICSIAFISYRDGSRQTWLYNLWCKQKGLFLNILAFVFPYACTGFIFHSHELAFWVIQCSGADYRSIDFRFKWSRSLGNTEDFQKLLPFRPRRADALIDTLLDTVRLAYSKRCPEYLKLITFDSDLSVFTVRSFSFTFVSVSPVLGLFDIWLQAILLLSDFPPVDVFFQTMSSKHYREYSLNWLLMHSTQWRDYPPWSKTRLLHSMLQRKHGCLHLWCDLPRLFPSSLKNLEIC